MCKQNDINRREFLKRLGIGAAATTTILAGCDSKNNPVTGNRTAHNKVPTDRMT